MSKGRLPNDFIDAGGEDEAEVVWIAIWEKERLRYSGDSF